MFEKLPGLKLIVTTGMRNAAIDLAAAKDHKVTVCGTDSAGHPTAELTVGLMIDLARKISLENARMKSGEAWQATVGGDLHGKTLGILGLGRLGQRVAKVGLAFGMKVVAWSQNLTPEKCREAGVEYATKDELLRQSDFITIHMVLSARSRGLIGAHELSLMKPTAYLINTSRGPLIDEAALIAALKENRIAGAGLDTYDIEPLPRDHPLAQIAECAAHAASRLCHRRQLPAVLRPDRGSRARLPRRQAHPRHRSLRDSIHVRYPFPHGVRSA